MVDTCASISLVTEALVRTISVVPTQTTSAIQLHGIGGNTHTQQVADIPLDFGVYSTTYRFYVVPQLPLPIMLGFDFLSTECGTLDLHSGSLSFIDGSIIQVASALASTACIAHNTHFTARTEMCFVAYCQEESLRGLDVLVTPNLQNSDIMLPKILTKVDHRGRMLLSASNWGTTPLSLPPGIVVGSVTPITPEVTVTDMGQTYRPANEQPFLERERVKLGDAQMTSEEWAEWWQMMDSFAHLFPSPDQPLGRTESVTHSIYTGDAVPVRGKPYRMGPHQQSIVRDQLDTMLDHGVIEPSNSPWASPIVLVRKKSGDFRFCVDYRHLNALTVKDKYPLPRIDETLESLRGATIFSTIDLRSGYWQVPVTEADKPKTAFTTKFGLFQFNVLPFGLCNAPSTFQRLMDLVLVGLNFTCALVYLDDIIIFSRTPRQHIENTRSVLQALDDAGLVCNLNKCLFCAIELTYLGHLVTPEGIRPHPDNVQKILSAPIPTNTDGVRRFLGLVGYYRRFVRGFGTLAAPLIQLLQKDIEFYWSNEQQQAFDALVQRVTQAPVLAYPDFSQNFTLHTDASTYAMGAVLTQPDVDGHWHPIAYASKSFSKQEQAYTVTERECLAIVWAVEHFRPYLFGRPYTVYTDHKALVWLFSTEHTNPRLLRWTLKLQAEAMTVKHRAGVANADADYLSRIQVVAPVHHHPLTQKEKYDTVLAQQQRADPELSPLIIYLITRQFVEGPYTRKQLRALVDLMMLVEGILYYVDDTQHDCRLRLVVPRCRREEVLFNAHDAPFAGHLGFAKTVKRLKHLYWWPTINKDTYEYVRSCEVCQRTKRKYVPEG
jgi:hypothetical protein